MEFVISLVASLLLALIFFNLFRINHNILNVLIAFLGIIPFFGPLLILALLVVLSCIVCVKSENEIYCDIRDGNLAVFIVDTKLNRWLFNMLCDEIFWRKEYNRRKKIEK